MALGSPKTNLVFTDKSIFHTNFNIFEPVDIASPILFVETDYVHHLWEVGGMIMITDLKKKYGFPFLLIFQSYNNSTKRPGCAGTILKTVEEIQLL